MLFKLISLLHFAYLVNEPFVEEVGIDIDTNFSVGLAIVVSTTNVADHAANSWAISLNVDPHLLSGKCFWVE